MTFLQTKLGRNYKWLYVFQFGFKASVVYRSSAIIWTLINLLVIFSTILIWWVNIDTGSKLFDFKSIFTYYILGDFSWWFFQNLIQIISLCLVALIGKDYIIASNPILITLYIFYGILGYLISVFFAYALGSIAFFLTDAHGIMDIQTESKYFLSGKALPLNSVSFLNVLTFLPFSFMFHHPMQIYLGKYNYIQIIQTFAGGIFWCIILWVLARLVFKAGLKKNEAVRL